LQHGGPGAIRWLPWQLKAPEQYFQQQSGRRITFDDLALEFTQAALPPYSTGKYSQENLSRAKVKRARHHLLMGYGKILEKCVRQDLLQPSLENTNITCCHCLFLLVLSIRFLLTVSFDPLD